ncbi:hypothetical protein [Sphingobium fuliginis]|uniref:hypothetical protein n=1 Tax=Sphingobium fuliginis (strain ATCC 27551) TaxID=336203 RepID=UPI001C3FD30A|nr:hypothetical protein [Sphingobium fuliginis]
MLLIAPHELLKWLHIEPLAEMCRDGARFDLTLRLVLVGVCALEQSPEDHHVPRLTPIGYFLAHGAKRFLPPALIEPIVILEVRKNCGGVIFHDLMRLSADRIGQKIIGHALQHRSDMAMAAGGERFEKIFAQNDRRRLKLSMRKVSVAMERHDVSQSALHAVKWVHDGNKHLASSATRPDMHSHFDSLLFQARGVHAFYMPEKINLDILIADRRLNYRSLRRMIIAVRDKERPIEGVRQLFCCLSLAEIIEILRGIRSIFRQLGYRAISLSPYIERLSADDEGLVA